MSLTDRVLRTIERHAMVPRGGRVIAAVSGGPDSVALVHLLRSLEQSGRLVVAGLAHFNHQLRGEASDADEQFCRRLAATLALPIEVGGADVRLIARTEKRSIEDAARRVRYAFLHGAAAALQADAIAVGHSRDDQAETFLLRLLRGAGTRGLASIRPKAGMVVRPLIEVSRAELRQLAVDEGLAYRTDETNADVSIPRNRVRHELLPYLERQFSPRIVEVLAREAALARDDDERLENEAIEMAASIVLTDTHDSTAAGRPTDATADRRVVLDTAGLASLHPALGSRVARLALRHLAGERFLGFEHIQRFLDFARSGAAGSALSLPGQQARLRVILDRFGEAARSVIELGPEPPRPRVAGQRRGENGPFVRIPLSIPGEVVLEEQRLVLSAAWADRPAAGESDIAGARALVTGLRGPLAVRSRQPGDRFQPPGLGGRVRKLQDYLVDRKVPRAARDLLPLVVDRDDRIVWIVGHAVAFGRAAAEPSQGVILLKAKYLGGEV